MNAFKQLYFVLMISAVIFPQGVYAQDEKSGAKFGVLTCEPIAGSKRNLLIRSSVDVICVYEDGDVQEHYKGESGIGLGIDLSWTSNEVIKWAVVAPSSDLRPDNFALVGKYYGAKAEASAGVGLQANVLVGGGDKSFTLQPVSVGGQTGIGVAAGLGYLYLEKN